MNYIKNPQLIETESFKIIQSIIDEEHPDYRYPSPREELIVKRVIHTSADFDYLENLKFTHDVTAKLEAFFQGGEGTLFTDTTMALSGINKRVLDRMGINYECYIADPEVAKIAKAKGITRSMAGIERAATIPGPKIFVIGNAPTAIFKILEMVNAGTLDVTAVVATPVGFVGAAESKEDIYESQLPAVVARGRKGGSNIAASIINAVLYQLGDRE